MPLAAHDLVVKYQTKGAAVTALGGVDLTLGKGEAISLIGPSGCGKSTLLHCLGGLLAPTSGAIQFDGERFTKPDASRAAFVFQDYSLLPWKSAVENAAIGLKFAGVAKRERRAKAMANLELVGLADFAESYPHELSGGMQQRVAVARALAMEPGVMLMDEPFGALDEQTRRQLGYEMSRLLTENGKSLIMVTHSLDESIFWADRIIVMSARPGRIVREIVVDEPRPRDLGFIATEKFAHIRAELLQMLTSSDEATAEPAADVDGDSETDAQRELEVELTAVDGVGTRGGTA
jgi:NitT/TauT family transport system ATP-binding protein